MLGHTLEKRLLVHTEHDSEQFDDDENYLRHFSDSMATSEILTRATLPRGERNGEREEGMLFPEVCFWVNHMNLTNTLFLSLMPNMESDCLKRCRLLFSPTIDQVHRKLLFERHFRLGHTNARLVSHLLCRYSWCGKPCVEKA